jgi:hypothetical protein
VADSPQLDTATRPFVADFIDPLFAIALHIGLAEGLIKEQWFHDWSWPIGNAAFNFFVFLLGFLTIVLSWVGYHVSIRANPIRGYMRFVFDISNSR